MDLNRCKKELLGKKPTAEAEDWLVEHVCSREARNATVSLCRHFFLDDFSAPFLEAISRRLYGEGRSEILGPYFEFISAEGGVDKIPYYKVKCFSHKQNSTLRTYVSTITSRHFVNLHAKDAAIEQRMSSLDEADREKSSQNFWEVDLKENRWFSLLISDEDPESLQLNDRLILARMHKAMEQLPERERKVLQLTVMDNASGLEAFEELKSELNTKINPDEMSQIDKQKAIAVLKHRALAHLEKLMRK